MAPHAKEISNESVHRQESLCMRDGFEPPHLPFALASIERFSSLVREFLPRAGTASALVGLAPRQKENGNDNRSNQKVGCGRFPPQYVAQSPKKHASCLNTLPPSTASGKAIGQTS